MKSMVSQSWCFRRCERDTQGSQSGETKQGQVPGRRTGKWVTSKTARRATSQTKEAETPIMSYWVCSSVPFIDMNAHPTARLEWRHSTVTAKLGNTLKRPAFFCFVKSWGQQKCEQKYIVWVIIMKLVLGLAPISRTKCANNLRYIGLSLRYC